MASKNKPRAGTSKRTPAAMRKAPAPKRGSRKPLLYLIGFGGLAVGTALWLLPSDQAIEVERTRYASRDACLQDWNDPADCEYVTDAAGAANAESASGASGASGGGSHGGHSGGGGQGSGTGPPDEAADKTAGTTADTDHVADTASPAGTTNNESNGGGHLSSVEGGWYGPYYARDGVVYHTSGRHTTGVPIQHGSVSSLTVRESALSAQSSAFRSTPRRVSITEGHAISRGGFLSSRGFGGEGGGGHGSGGG